MQSYYTHVFQKNLFVASKATSDARGFCPSDTPRMQVCAEYQGSFSMHLHHLPLVFPKVPPIYFKKVSYWIMLTRKFTLAVPLKM